MKHQHWEESVHLAHEFGASVVERKEHQRWEGAHFVEKFWASGEQKQYWEGLLFFRV